jgi:SAM-dependent methyltransferase
MTLHRAGRRRESFDEVALLYNAARPGYPPTLVDDLMELAGMNQGHRVLEIGPGTGQLTVPLAERGLSLIGVELGTNMARIARRNLSSFTNVEVVVADFDTWALPVEPFDLVVAATAFHWLDPATRLERCAKALRSGGILAILETHWGVSDREDSFWTDSQSCYSKWDPDYDSEIRPVTLRDLPLKRTDIANSPIFELVAHRRYHCDRRYDAVQYCNLLGTFSNIRALTETARMGFLACVQDLINKRFGGYILRHDVYDLWLARTSTIPR